MEGSRAMPALIVGILLMSEYIGAKSTIGTAQAAFESGIAASWSVLGAAIGFPLFGLILVKRIYNTGKITISGAIAEKYGTSTKNIISLIMIYALLLVNVGNYVSGAAAISTVLKVNLPVAAFITAIVSTFYFAFGGMKGVAWVTMLHSALKYAGLLIILGFALSKTGGFTPMIENMPDYYWTWDGNIGAGTIFAWLIGTIGSIFCTQFVIQAISSTKDVRSAKRSTWIAFFFCLPIALAIAIIGVAAKYLHPEINSLYALPVFLQDMNPWLAGLVTTSLVASIFVSVSTVALAIASLVVKDGSLMCVWFGGSQEGKADISIWGSRLATDSDRWSEAVKLSDDPDRSEQNPVLFQAPDQVVWLLWTAQYAGNQDTAIVRYRQSHDGGQSWGPIDTLLDQPGTFIRQPISVMPDGSWLLPVFYCRTEPGEKWVGNNDVSAVKISSDGGISWRDVAVPESLGCVHMSITPHPDGGLAAFFRSRWADHIWFSHSSDQGESWSAPAPTTLPNNNSSIQATTLDNGELVLVFNNMSAAGATERRASLYDEIADDDGRKEPETTGKSAFWGAPRAPMTVAISPDGGKSWPWLRNLDEGDGYCMTNNSEQKLNREFSYPSIKQGADGNLHIAYTWYRQAIKYVRVSPQWVKGESA
ncbi:TPA: sodium:solute symporter family transporter [Klebsiella quasipneumoniae]